MTARRTLARALAFAAAIALPAPAAAQYDLGGFVGTVTLASYGECQDFFCADAVIAIGKSRSGDFFARLVHFDHTFDADGWHEAIDNVDLYLGHDVTLLEFGFQEPIPENAELPWHNFIFDGEYQTESPRYASAPGPDWLLVAYTRYQREVSDPSGAEFGTELAFRMGGPTISKMTVSPEPMTLGLVGSGLLVLGGIAHRSRRRDTKGPGVTAN